MTRQLSRARSRRGMTLTEVIVAMMLLVGVVLVLGGFSAKFSQASGQARLIVNANELAAYRLDAVRQQPTYTALDSLGPKVDSVSPWTKRDFTAYTVRTDITHTGGGVLDSLDYKTVTVTVTHPQMKKIVKKTTAIAAF